MILDKQHDSSTDENMHLGPIYKSFASSLAICLLLSAFVLVGFIVRSISRRTRKLTPANYSSTWTPKTMSSSQDESLPYPTLGSSPVEPELPDPLAGVYLPITSGQLAALADKKARQGGAGQSGENIEGEIDQLENVGEQISAYIRYFEDNSEQETWQRKVVIYNKANENAT